MAAGCTSAVPPPRPAPIDSSTLRSRSLRLHGYTNNELSPDQRADSVRHIAAEAARGAPTVDHEPMPLADIGSAWERRSGGRVVLVP